ncbi:hypothetical protein niasHT_021782 [Heterodera trifolii]|uniref:UV excision repair protein RAD23 n=1 Tax=Heterodera trifolii TaxID=157864 RepID=A0ABD2J8R2_9BILA
MPELLFKTITQQSFTIEVEETATIGEVKRKIQEAKGAEYPAENQKLIFNGRMLEDAMLVSELNFAAPKFIVIMVMRKPAQAPSTVRSATSSTSPQKKTSTADGQAPKAEKSAENKATGATSNTSVAQSGAATGVPAEHAQTVANIEAMGYPRQEVVRALQAALFDADRAVDYLCNGIPEGPSLQGSNSGSDIGAVTEDGQLMAALEDPQGLSFLAQSPQFQQLRDIVHTDPSMLPQILQQIATVNPQLMEAINNNQAMFLQMLNGGQPLGGGTNAVAGGGVMTGGQDAALVAVSAQDRLAITRIASMGFPEALVVEAYFACDKNEDLAVNYILARMDESQNGRAGAGQQGGR